MKFPDHLSPLHFKTMTIRSHFWLQSLLPGLSGTYNNTARVTRYKRVDIYIFLKGEIRFIYMAPPISASTIGREYSAPFIFVRHQQLFYASFRKDKLF